MRGRAPKRPRHPEGLQILAILLSLLLVNEKIFTIQSFIIDIQPHAARPVLQKMDPMHSEMIKNSVLEMLVQDEIMAQALAEKGYLDLSEECLRA